MEQKSIESELIPKSYTKDAKIISIMNTFGLIQGFIVIFSLVAGATILLKVMFIRCKNFSTIFLVTLSGFFHCFYCVVILNYVKQSLNGDCHHGCLDFYPVSILSNAIIFLAITLSAMKTEAENTKRSHPIQKVLLTFDTIMGTALLLYANSLEKDHLETEHKPSLDIVKSVHMYFTVCEKDIHKVSYIFAIEYILFYAPLIWILVNILRQNYLRDEDFRMYKFQILRKCCHDYENDDCRCNLFNTLFQAILFYNGVCLLVIRPIFIFYSLADNSLYRDILPSLTNTVMFVLLCIEYLTAELKSHIRPSKTSLDKIETKDLKSEPDVCILAVSEGDIKKAIPYDI